MSVVESSPTKPASRIVVGVDGSDSSKQALLWARYLAKAMSCSVEAVNVWQPVQSYGVGYGWVALPTDWNPATDAEVLLQDTIKEVYGDDLPVDLKITTLEGLAAKELLKASDGAQMLVVGSRGHGGFAGLLLGSVSSACSEHATCPVLVVRGETPPPPA